MFDVVGDVAAESAAVVLYALGTGVLAAVGLFAEFEGVQNVLTGHAGLGLWLGYMGAIALVAGATLARRGVLPRLAAGRGE